jgi:ABC-type uncharacterized transport system ATPase subunit
MTHFTLLKTLNDMEYNGFMVTILSITAILSKESGKLHVPERNRHDLKKRMLHRWQINLTQISRPIKPD